MKGYAGGVASCALSMPFLPTRTVYYVARSYFSMSGYMYVRGLVNAKVNDFLLSLSPTPQPISRLALYLFALHHQARPVVPLDTVDNSNSVWELGIPPIRGRSAPTGQAKAKPAHRSTMSSIATPIWRGHALIGVPLLGAGTRPARPGARSRSPAELSTM